MKKFLLLTLLLSACSQNATVSFDRIPDQEFLEGNTPYFRYNPYNNAPLSAELLIKNPPQILTITVLGKNGKESDLSYTWTNSQATSFPILGLYFQHTNTIIISDGTTGKTLQYFVDEQASDVIKTAQIIVNKRPNTPERSNFLNFINPVARLTDLLAYDNFGDLRWYFRSDKELHGMKFLYNSNDVQFSILDTTDPQILTFNMLGQTINTIKIAEIPSFNVREADKRLHHDMFTKSNGNIIVLDKSQYGVEDALLEIDPKGTIIQEILIGDWIRNAVNGNPKDNTGLEEFVFDSENNPVDEYRSEIRYPGMPEKANAIDWAHINALSYDESSDTLYLSFRQHGVFAFDYNNKKLKWISIRSNYAMPDSSLPFYNLPEDFKYAYEIPALAPFILNGSGADHPHAVTYIGNRQFMVFDNSGNDNLNPEEGSRLLVLEIDETNKTSSVAWEYRHTNDNNSLLYSQIVSDIDKTPFDSYIGLFGTIDPFRFIEISDNKEVLFDMQFDISVRSAGDSAVALPVACPTSRTEQNGVFIYRGDYQSIYPSSYISLD